MATIVNPATGELFTDYPDGVAPPTGWVLGSVGSATQSGVDPSIPLQQWQYDAALRAGDLGVSQTNAEANMYGAQTNRAIGVLNAYPTITGPSDYAQFENLMAGQPSAAGIAVFDQAAGLANPSGYAPVNPADLSAKTWDSTGMGDLFAAPSSSATTGAATGAPAYAATSQSPVIQMVQRPDGSWQPAPIGGATADGSSGPSSIDWKNERAAAGIRADDSNPNIDAAFKSGTPVSSSTATQMQQDIANTDTRYSANDPANNANAAFPNGGNDQTNPYKPAPAPDKSKEKQNDAQNKPLNTVGNDNGTVVNSTDPGRDRAAMGTDRVVTGPQTIHVGEHGKDERVVVIPLQNPRVALDPRMAGRANAMVTGAPYHAHPATQPPMLGPRYIQSMPRVLHMEDGGDTTVYGGGPPAVIAPGATVTSSNKPFSTNPATGTPQMISDTGQVQAPDAKNPGKYVTIPSYTNSQYVDPSQLTPESAHRIQRDPVLLAMYNSILQAKGVAPESYWSAFQSYAPTGMVAPSRLAYPSGTF